MRFSKTVARLVTERRGMMWAIVIAIAAACFAILVTRLRLDTEILNLLPRGFPSVEGLKVYNNEFEQTRELTFALLCQPEDIDKLEEFAPRFVERLHSQPWCVRVLAGSPLETPQGIADLQHIALPLLLNLDPDEFDRAISLLQPQRIRERLEPMPRSAVSPNRLVTAPARYQVDRRRSLCSRSPPPQRARGARFRGETGAARGRTRTGNGW